ncbi:restriction endonuclease subunit S [Streptomyces sp. NPDC048282]|uniref:restriction endonuclease subunit S n=1 Tax=Streptomyces sp. NPDC048282 TaxID=3365528 RepID=UPI0037216E34
MTFPAHWHTRRARFAFSRRDVRGADAPLASATKDGVSLRSDLDYGVWNPDSNVTNYKLVEPDDFVIGLRSFQHGISHSAVRGLVSPAYTVLRPVADLDPAFFKYYFRSSLLISHLANITQGIRQGQAIDIEAFQNLPVPVPELEEQRRIADFLDAETGKIDDLIFKKRRLLNLMNEHIDSDVLQQVGASQIVCSTAGTPTLPIRRILTKVVRPAIPGFGVITAYRDGQVTQRDARRSEGYTLSASTEAQGQHVLVDDVVVHGLDGFAGAIGASDASGNCSPVYHVCVPKADGDSRFLGRLLRLLALQGYLGNFAISTRERAVDFRNWSLFGDIPIPVVAADLQRAIGERISKLSPLRTAIERSDVLAAERRQSLITAAVTGQFDVSTASGRNVTDGVTA